MTLSTKKKEKIEAIVFSSVVSTISLGCIFVALRYGEEIRQILFYNSYLALAVRALVVGLGCFFARWSIWYILFKTGSAKCAEVGIELATYILLILIGCLFALARVNPGSLLVDVALWPILIYVIMLCRIMLFRFTGIYAVLKNQEAMDEKIILLHQKINALTEQRRESNKE